MRVLLHGETWDFFHPWIILASLLLKSWGQHQMKAKRSCNCIMTFWQYFFRKLKYAATNKPVMMINLGGVWPKRRLHIHVSVVMGNQKSQDYICGRNSINSGNAGSRVHHSCTTSGLQASNMVASCCLANPDVISQLNKIAMNGMNVFLVLQRLLVTHSQGQPPWRSVSTRSISHRKS
jgi:hypothetical protein